MQKLIIILVVLLLPLIAFSQETNWFEGTFDDAKELAKEQGKQLLIYFSSST